MRHKLITIIALLVALIGPFAWVYWGPIARTVTRSSASAWESVRVFRIWQPRPAVKVPAAQFLPAFSGKTMKGISWDYKTEIEVPWDDNDTTGTIYQCWRVLKSKTKQCGLCMVHPGDPTIGAGRTGALWAQTDLLGCAVGVS